MHISFFNPAGPPGAILERSYSGGYGDIFSSHDTSVIRFPPLALLRLAGVARAAGHEVSAVDRQVCRDAQIDSRCDVLVGTISLPTLESDCAQIVEQRRGLGNVATYIYTPIRHEPICRAALQRSGARLLLHADSVPIFASIIEGHTQAGASWLDGDKLISGARVPEHRLDDEPFPARDILPRDPYEFSPFAGTRAPTRPITTAQSSYGCPYPCGYYCPYPSTEGRKFRAYSAQHVVAELREIAALEVRGVVFRDPVFTLDVERSLEICDGIIDCGLDLLWWCETRLDRLPETLIDRMAAAGCVGMEIGIESGDDAILRGSARKQITTSNARELRARLKNAGIAANYLFIMGLPGEDRGTIARTMRLILELELEPGRFNLATITPYPETKLHAEALAKGWIDGGWNEFTSFLPVMRTDQLTKDDLASARILAGALERVVLDGSLRARDQFLHDLSVWVETPLVS
jgi:radical SAM superfamily enzyme YgiQ (UPF0313 family)